MDARIAIIYDFDGTLSPQPMQEYTVLRQLDIAPQKFWDEVRMIAQNEREEPMLTYMRLIIEEAEKKGVHLSRANFTEMAKKIEYFPGVESWFSRINSFVKNQSHKQIEVSHYIISAGMKEILEGIKIIKEFRQIYASEYHYDHHGRPTFPKQIITDTTKTQHLFRINKGREDLAESINEHMPPQARPVPFSNIIYIGDGMTDVPSMAVTRANGGHAIAVYPQAIVGDKSYNHGYETCKKLLQAGRVDFIAPSDYSPKLILEKRVQILLKSIITKIDYEHEISNCHQEYGI